MVESKIVGAISPIDVIGRKIHSLYDDHRAARYLWNQLAVVQKTHKMPLCASVGVLF